MENTQEQQKQENPNKKSFPINIDRPFGILKKKSPI